VGAAWRILTLAIESLDMMWNITEVVKNSLDRADALVSCFLSAELWNSIVHRWAKSSADGWCSASWAGELKR